MSGLALAVNVAVLDAESRVLMTKREDFDVWCLHRDLTVAYGVAPRKREV